MKRSDTSKPCTLETVQNRISYMRSQRECKYQNVDLQMSEGHTEVTFVGIGIRVLNNQRVACFYIPTTCMKRKYVEDKVNDILDKLEASSGGGDHPW